MQPHRDSHRRHAGRSGRRGRLKAGRFAVMMILHIFVQINHRYGLAEHHSVCDRRGRTVVARKSCRQDNTHPQILEMRIVRRCRVPVSRAEKRRRLPMSNLLPLCVRCAYQSTVRINSWAVSTRRNITTGYTVAYPTAGISFPAVALAYPSAGGSVVLPAMSPMSV